MSKFICICCQEKFAELSPDVYRHLYDCTKKQIQTKDLEISNIQEKLQGIILKNYKAISDIHALYNEANMKIKQNYDSSIQTIKNNPQVELYKSQLETQKLLYNRKYNNELKQVQAQYAKSLEELNNEHEHKLNTVHGNCEHTKKQCLDKINTLTVLAEELKNKTIQLDKERKEKDNKIQNLLTEISQLTQTNAETLYEKNKLIKELLDKQKSLLQEIDEINIICNKKNTDINNIQLQFDKDKEGYIKEITHKFNLYKIQLKEKFEEEVQLRREREKEVFELREKTKIIEEKNNEITRLNNVIETLQKRVQEWMRKYDELEKEIRENKPKNNINSKSRNRIRKN